MQYGSRGEFCLLFVLEGGRQNDENLGGLIALEGKRMIVGTLDEIPDKPEGADQLKIRLVYMQDHCESVEYNP
jgi:hypothetical protein